MLDLLEQFTITEIIAFTIGLALALKGIWDFIDFLKEKYKEKFDKDFAKKKREEELEEHYADCKKRQHETLEQYNSLNNKIDGIADSIEEIDDRISLLSKNDQHTIKQIIVKDYHYFTKKGWIDEFSLDSLLLLFEDYKRLGGNSYVESLMEEIKRLPHQEP